LLFWLGVVIIGHDDFLDTFVLLGLFALPDIQILYVLFKFQLVLGLIVILLLLLFDGIGNSFKARVLILQTSILLLRHALLLLQARHLFLKFVRILFGPQVHLPPADVGRVRAVPFQQEGLATNLAFHLPQRALLLVLRYLEEVLLVAAPTALLQTMVTDVDLRIIP
jgi:hypothetical protein